MQDGSALVALPAYMTGLEGGVGPRGGKRGSDQVGPQVGREASLSTEALQPRLRPPASPLHCFHGPVSPPPTALGSQTAGDGSKQEESSFRRHHQPVWGARGTGNGEQGAIGAELGAGRAQCMGLRSPGWRRTLARFPAAANFECCWWQLGCLGCGMCWDAHPLCTQIHQ